MPEITTVQILETLKDVECTLANEGRCAESPAARENLLDAYEALKALRPLLETVLTERDQQELMLWALDHGWEVTSGKHSDEPPGYYWWQREGRRIGRRVITDSTIPVLDETQESIIRRQREEHAHANR